MAGCINGIDTVEVKAPNGEPSLLFAGLVDLYSGNLDYAYRAYLQSHLPAFDSLKEEDLDVNGEPSASVVYERVQSLGDDYSKALGEEKVDDGNKGEKPATTGVMTKVMEASRLILDPLTDKEGNQADTYGITNTAGGAAVRQLGRVSNLIGEFSLRKMSMTKPDGTPYKSLIDAIAQHEADREFAGKKADETITEQGIEYTKDQYIEFKKSVYKQGQIKGEIIHALIQRQIALYNKEYATAEKLSAKIFELESRSTTPQGSYNWVVEKENLEAILKNAGIVVDPAVPTDFRDKVYSEVAVASSTMGVAGRIDTIVEKPDGRLKVVDYKTGRRFDNRLTGRIMKYGNQVFNIEDNAMGRAKLQTMLYSVIIKANNPEARFDLPVIMHIPDRTRAKSPFNAHTVEVSDYLRMIEQFYKHEKPDIYRKLIAESPNIFDATHYGTSARPSAVQDLINQRNGIRPDERLKEYKLELQQLDSMLAIRRAQDPLKGKATQAEINRKNELLRLILEAESHVVLPNAGDMTKFDVSFFTQWVGSIYDIHNPHVQAYSQVVKRAQLAMQAEYDKVENEWDRLYTEALEEHYGKIPQTKKAFLVNRDLRPFFNEMISKTTTIDEMDGKPITRYGLIKETDPGWNKLSEKKKNMVRYMRSTMQKYYNEVLIDGPEAVIGSQYGKPMTKLDMYNQMMGVNFQMSDEFIPKVGVTPSEVRWSMKDKGDLKSWAKYQVVRRLSMFLEDNVEGDNQKQYGIPVKHLGSSSTFFNPDIHSSNLDTAFLSFMTNMLNKKHYDSVYALGSATVGVLEMQTDAAGNPSTERASKFLKYWTDRVLAGKRPTDDNITRKGITLGTAANGQKIQLSLSKLVRFLNQGVAAAVLWVNIPAGIANGLQAMWAVSKESAASSLASTKWGGIDVSQKDLSFKNHSSSYKEVIGFYRDMILGRGRSNPVGAFIRKFRVFPDLPELGGRSTIRPGSTGYFWQGNRLAFLYSFAENFTTSVLALDFLKTMKVQSGKYAGQNMWDIYKNSMVVDPVTGNTDFVLPADFTRGKVRLANGELEELKGLDHRDIQKLNRVIQRVKGGYRQDERTMLESTIFGELFMMFRRWLPANLVNAFKSKFEDTSMADLVKSDQEDVYEYQARLTEGKFRVMGGMIGQLLGLNKEGGYSWDDLSVMQKRNLIDFALTILAWSTTAIAVGAVFGTDDDEDTLKKWSWNMVGRIGEQWNPYEMLSATANPPAVVRSALELFQGLGEMSVATATYVATGDEDDLFTQRGHVHGAARILKNLPYTASYWKTSQFVENSEYLKSAE